MKKYRPNIFSSGSRCQQQHRSIRLRRAGGSSRWCDSSSLFWKYSTSSRTVSHASTIRNLVEGTVFAPGVKHTAVWGEGEGSLNIPEEVQSDGFRRGIGQCVVTPAAGRPPDLCLCVCFKATASATAGAPYWDADTYISAEHHAPSRHRKKKKIERRLEIFCRTFFAVSVRPAARAFLPPASPPVILLRVAPLQK